MSHRCPAPRCCELIPSSLVMCRRHWLMVDKITQQAVYEAYHTNPGSSVHLSLIRDAITQVKEKEPA